MNQLAPRAASIFQRLVQLNKEKINNSEAFMPVFFEYLHDTPEGKIYSIAHYFVQNGDMMADPEMTFLWINENTIIPLSYRLDSLGKYQECCDYNDKGQIIDIDEKMQFEMCRFAYMWMNNIAEQQSI